MNELKIKKDGKTIFDSHGATLERSDSLAIAGDVMDSITSPRVSSEILVNIKTIPSSPSTLVEDELNHSVTKL